MYNPDTSKTEFNMGGDKSVLNKDWIIMNDSNLQWGD